MYQQLTNIFYAHPVKLTKVDTLIKSERFNWFISLKANTHFLISIELCRERATRWWSEVKLKLKGKALWQPISWFQMKRSGTQSRKRRSATQTNQQKVKSIRTQGKKSSAVELVTSCNPILYIAKINYSLHHFIMCYFVLSFKNFVLI